MKLTIEDMRKIKEAAKAGVNLRAGNYRAKIHVFLGACGIAAGGRAVMRALLDEISRQEVSDVIVTTSGCAGLCGREPMIEVEIQGAGLVRYGDLNAEKMREIFAAHILGGKAIEQYVIAESNQTTVLRSEDVNG